MYISLVLQDLYLNIHLRDTTVWETIVIVRPTLWHTFTFEKNSGKGIDCRDGEDRREFTAEGTSATDLEDFA
jgi:hypothetical protein